VPRNKPRDDRASVATSRSFAAHRNGVKPVSVSPSGPVTASRKRPVQRLAGDLLDQPAEHHQADTGVPEGGARPAAAHQRGGQHRGPAGGGAGRSGDLGADRQRAGVREQHGDGDRLLAGAAELGQVPAYWRVQIHLSPVDQLKHEDRGVDLGQ
jgi:hypothetical protein